MLCLVDDQRLAAALVVPMDALHVELAGVASHAGHFQRPLFSVRVLSGGVLSAAYCLADVFQTRSPLAQPACDLLLLSHDQLLDSARTLRLLA